MVFLFLPLFVLFLLVVFFLWWRLLCGSLRPIAFLFAGSSADRHFSLVLVVVVCGWRDLFPWWRLGVSSTSTGTNLAGRD